jgi:hypothetical protein
MSEENKVPDCPNGRQEQTRPESISLEEEMQSFLKEQLEHIEKKKKKTYDDFLLAVAIEFQEYGAFLRKEKEKLAKKEQEKKEQEKKDQQE